MWIWSSAPGSAAASRPTCSALAGRGGCCWPASPPWLALCRSPTPRFRVIFGCFSPGISSADGYGSRTTETSLIGMVLAAGAGRRLRPDTDALPKALLPVDGQVTILDIALRNLVAVGLRDIVIVVGYAADAVRPAGRPGAGARGPADAAGQRPGRGVEQRLLALAGPRAFCGGRPAGQRGHGASGLGGEDAAGRRTRGHGERRRPGTARHHHRRR